MLPSSAGDVPGFLKGGAQDGLSRAGRHAEPRERTVTLPALFAAPTQRALRSRMLSLLLLLTLAAGWTDALCYLALGGVFASFMTGNILFIGLSIGQGNTALLVRTSTVVLLFLVSITLSSLYLQSLPAQMPPESWRGTLARYLLVQGLILLAFALVWALGGSPAQDLTRQVVLLGIAAVGMGTQGALVAKFAILDVVSVAMTGTELLLGIRLAQLIGRQPANRQAATSVLFLVALILLYSLAALIVALTMSWIGAVFIPCALVVVAVAALEVPPRNRAVGSLVRNAE